MNKQVLAPLCVLTLAAAAAAQSGRTMQLNTPATINRTVAFQMNHPVSAANNWYAFLWSPPYPGVTPFSAPGLTVVGDVRINPNDNVAAWMGLLDNSGARVHTVAVPPNPIFIGYPFNLQSVDIDVNNLVVSFADNELDIVVSAGLCGVTLARVASNSTSIANANVMDVTDASIGAPVSQGLAGYSYLVTRHRGDEGFVEGQSGTFSGTAHQSDLDSVSFRRVGRAMHGTGYQTVVCPNGYDVSIVRDFANPKQFGLLSHERSTGITRIIPGSTWVDTSTTATPAQQMFYPGFSRDGVWGAIYVKDSNTTTPFTQMVWAFRTDGMSPVVDITPAGGAQWFDGTLAFTNDFLLASGSNGLFWTSATAPATMQPLATPNTAATNMPNIWAFPFSWRVSPGGSTAFFPLSSISTSSRAEMDMAMLANVGGSPVVVNYTQFTLPTGMTEFGYSAITPSTGASSTGIKASVSPDGTKIAFLPTATTTTTTHLGICVADGTPNPTIHTVVGALFYSEVAFINNTTVMFFAGPTNLTTSLYRLDVPTGTISQVGTAADIQTRGQFWSLNKNWWYFIRSASGNPKSNIVAVDCATGAVHDVTGTEFGGGGAVGDLRNGGINSSSNDPWFCLEMMMRRAPVGNMAYFTARKETGVSAVFEDANVFAFDIENGGVAVQLSNNTGTGASTAIRHIESLTISADGNHVAWAQKVGTSTANSEDVFHLDLLANTITQVSVSAPTGQTIADGQLRFTCNPPSGIAWVVGTGSTAFPVTNARAQWVPLGGTTPVTLTGAITTATGYWMIGTR